MQVIEVVVGGQYGSEAKGHVTAQLVRQAHQGAGLPDPTVINVRVAGPNAGHTVYDDEGRSFAFRQVPVGAVIPGTVAYIAPGSEVDLPVLLDEVHRVREFGHHGDIAISREVTLIEDDHKATEAEGGLTVASGNSTGKGIGAARAARALRKAKRLADDQEALDLLTAAGVFFAEPADIYASDMFALVGNQHIIVEGTQGYGLGLHAGHYPKVTSSDCTALDFLAMAGVAPWRGTVRSMLVWVVARAFPIRIAGDSGPLAGETTWEELGLPEELTTVTQKVRRVGMWDGDLVRRAVQANGGANVVRVALTMADQRIPDIAGFDGTERALVATPLPALEALGQWVADIESEVGAQVGAVTTSPTTIAWVRR